MSFRNGKSVVESLEGRTMFAADPSAVLLNGMLEITGTRRSEAIEVSLDAADATKVNVSIDGALFQQFDLAAITSVRVSGGNGHDVISVIGLTVASELSGGNGKDTLTSGAGDDVLMGGNGRDIMSSGAGNDRLDGGNGVDTIDAGDGDDTIDGGRGRDLLTGGLGADQFLGRDHASEIVDLAADDTHAVLTLKDYRSLRR